MKQSPCPDCGPDGVNHFAHRMSIVLEWFLSPFIRPITAVTRSIAPLFAWVPWEHGAVALFDTLAALRLVRIGREPDEKDTERTRVMWRAAKARDIDVREVRVLNMPQTNTFVARFGGKIRVFEGLSRPERMHAASVGWMDNKGIMKHRFSAVGIPVAAGAVCFSWSRAKKTFENIRKPIIIKPHLGSRSRHTTVHIETLEALAIAFNKAKQLSPWIIVEEELVGDVYRGTFVGGNLVATMRRELPHVVGDGVSTIEKLVQKENSNPKRHGPIFHEIPMDSDADQELARQGLIRASVPPKGVVVTLNQKVGRSFGASNTDVTDIIHPDNKAMLENAARVLGDSLVGIDFIMRDITVSWRTQERCGIIECNSLPFIDLHHYPLVGTPRDVAGALWDIVFPAAKIASTLPTGITQSPSIAKNS